MHTVVACKLRKSPPVCFWISVVKLILGKLRLSRKYLGKTVNMPPGQKFTVFRHITRYPIQKGSDQTTFLISFKFSRLSQHANRIASILPMLMITGFPGFDSKVYGVNKKNGYWQGMYQWQTKQALEEYKKSFVFRLMNRRAAKNTLKSMELENQNLTDFLDNNLV